MGQGDPNLSVEETLNFFSTSCPIKAVVWFIVYRSLARFKYEERRSADRVTN